MKAFLTMTFVASIVALLGGCAALIHAQNPEEFRQRARPSYTEQHTVNRPYKTVSDTIARKARECLNASYRKEYTEYNGPYATRKQSTVTFKPTVQVTSTRTTIAVQQAYLPRPPDFLDFQKTPPDGLYIIVADAYPHGNQTRLVLYGTTKAWMPPIPRAIMNWAAGTNMGCPDLSSV